MNRKERLWILPVICLIGIMSGFAATKMDEKKPTVTMEIVGKQEVLLIFHLQYTLHYTGENPNPRFVLKPQTAEDTLKIIYVDKVSSNSSISIKNGDTIQGGNITWSVSVRAVKPGLYTTPDYAIIVGRDTLDIPCVKREIMVEGKRTTTDRENNVVDKKSKILKIKESLDKNEINLGDSLTVTYTLYTTSDYVKELFLINDFDLKDCFFESLPPDEFLSVDSLDGKMVASAIIARYKVLPLKKGSFSIPSLEYRVNACYPTYRQDPFFGEIRENEEEEIVTLKTKKMNFKVK